MTNTQILVTVLVLVAVWIYHQSQQPSLASKGTQTELQTKNKSTQTKEKEVKRSQPTQEVGTQYEYQPIHHPKGTDKRGNTVEPKTKERELIKIQLEKFRKWKMPKIQEIVTEEQTELSSSRVSLNEAGRVIKEKEFPGKTLQEYLEWKYPTQEDKEGVRVIDVLNMCYEARLKAGIKEKLEGGELDLREFEGVEKVSIWGRCLKTKLTKLNIDGLVNLTFLYCADNNLPLWMSPIVRN